jgi:biotin carboxyl carrier protein
MKRELVVTVGGREIEITVEPPAYPQAPDARWRLIVDGRELAIDARPIRPGTWSLLVDGRSHVVDLDPRAGGTALTSALVAAVARVEDARTRKLARAVAHGAAGPPPGEALRAPIAGKVVKVLVAEGDLVAAGQGVVVLEAMKMENELAAERGGTVATVHKQAGQSVESGELLVTLT